MLTKEEELKLNELSIQIEKLKKEKKNCRVKPKKKKIIKMAKIYGIYNNHTMKRIDKAKNLP